MAENDNTESPAYGDDEPESGLFRWMSAAVVLLAVAGFFGLAWYAYKSGGEAVDEKDVEVVKADKTPVKEAPANPGGMQIPNQDKTVYGLVSGAKEKPTVERILPPPEEPVTRAGDNTETWMSDKAKSKIGGEDTDTTATAPAVVAQTEPEAPKKTEQFNPQKALEEKEKAAKEKSAVVTPPAAPASPAPAAPKAEVKAKPVVAKAVPEVKKPAAVPEASVAPASGNAKPLKGVRVQLGAFKSEDEAKENWTKIDKKFSEELAGKDHAVQRADLGEKGIYYRLQAGPFTSAKDAESFCLTLVSAGQGCILARSK